MRSSGHGSSTQAHAPLIAPAPTAPSSLLPTQTHPPDAPPSSYRDIGDEESGRAPGQQRRMSSFLGRSLRGLRIRSARQSVTSLPGASNPPTTTVSPSASTALLPGASPRTSVYDPATFGRTSIFRPQSPTLGALPEPAFPRVPEIRGPVGPVAHALGPHALTASGAPVWPGLGAAHGQPAMPSPALTEGSSVNAPEGLLDPRLALRLGAQGMQSQGALSFRDDQDYSRPIGGVSSTFVNIVKSSRSGTDFCLVAVGEQQAVQPDDDPDGVDSQRVAAPAVARVSQHRDDRRRDCASSRRGAARPLGNRGIPVRIVSPRTLLVETMNFGLCSVSGCAAYASIPSILLPHTYCSFVHPCTHYVSHCASNSVL
ncbi:hypothetical protein NUW54_g1349 [Trametes sanguinea]|uniref:Uncharacterized protein n=1 Tax=Trametes sanguinea TaxID=158606 RepID=A0ACC1Q6K6_9APHY|nr:hypothetical protein NUW54_g1349 [Trametes sanguinea]